ncbi:MAG: hypothetical protein AAGG99_05455, partial [Pseudomonadota bacterium]
MRAIALGAVLIAGAPIVIPHVAHSQIATPQETAPQAPLEDRVRATLRRHCAQCHARDPKTGRAARGRLGAITDLGRLARSPFVVPGAPDISPLYATLHQHHAPHAVFAPFAERVGPEPAEIAAVRSWIAGLDPAQRTACAAGESPVARPRVVVRAALRHLAGLPQVARRRTRFLSFAHLAGLCRPASERAEDRRALIEMLRRLTWKPGTPKLIGVPLRAPRGRTALSSDAFLFAIDLDVLGWSAETWERLARRARGVRIKPTGRLARRLTDATGSAVALRTAGSFAHAVMTANTMRDVLGVPSDPTLFAALLGIADLGAENSLVDAIPRSRVTGHPRAIQHLDGRDTRVWLARDLPEPERALSSEGSTTPASQSGDAASDTDRTLLSRPSLRAHFRLPNGARAFAVLDDPNIATAQPQPTRAPNAATNACRACHAMGAVTVVRAQARARQKAEQENNAKDRSDASRAAIIE